MIWRVILFCWLGTAFAWSHCASPCLGQFNPTICDFRGNVLGYVTNGAIVWNPSRPTAYGAVPGYRPVALGNGANVPQSSAFGSLWPDMTSYYNVYRRIYDPITGHWLSGDPSWNERDPNWYTLCGGDPVNYTDANGMYGKEAVNFSYGIAQGIVQVSTGLPVNRPSNMPNYYGQLDGRDLAGLVSLWLTGNGAANAGTGSGIMVASSLAEGATGGTASLFAGPAFAGGAVTAAGGAIETGVGAYGLYNFSRLTPLQSPSGDSGGGGSGVHQEQPVYEMPEDWPGQTMSGMAKDHAIPQALDPENPIINDPANLQPMPAAMNSVDKAPFDAELAQRYRQLVDDLVRYGDLSESEAKAKAWEAMETEINAHANSVPARPMDPNQLDQLPSK